jgi:hypothetical protein
MPHARPSPRLRPAPWLCRAAPRRSSATSSWSSRWTPARTARRACPARSSAPTSRSRSRRSCRCGPQGGGWGGALVRCAPLPPVWACAAGASAHPRRRGRSASPSRPRPPPGHRGQGTGRRRARARPGRGPGRGRVAGTGAALPGRHGGPADRRRGAGGGRGGGAQGGRRAGRHPEGAALLLRTGPHAMSVCAGRMHCLCVGAASQATATELAAAGPSNMSFLL